MSGKLLKICAAVMLIASAGDVVYGEPKATEGGRRFTSTSAEAKIEAKVKALVLVDFGGDSKMLSLVKENGEEETDADKTEFCFNVKSVAVGYGLLFEAIGNLKGDNNGAFWLHDDEGQKLPILIDLRDGEDSSIPFKVNQNIPFSENYKAGQWKLKVSTELKSDTLVGDYTGGIKISVVAID